MSVSFVIATLKRLGRADVIFWALPWLMVLIVLGTWAQKDIGIYEAQKIYFSSFVFFLGFIPLPGAYTILPIILISLLSKFIFTSHWKWNKVGVHLTHLSVIVLLLGGMVTAFTMHEGYIPLQENQNPVGVVTDYNKRVLSLQDDGQYFEIPFYDLIKGEPIKGLPFSLIPLTVCRNIGLTPNANMRAQNGQGRGAAQMVDVACVPLDKDDEKNVSGLTYRVDGAKDTRLNGVYVAFEGRQTHDIIDGFQMRFDRETRELPFSVSMKRFTRDVYPGTNKPREYESVVIIHDGDLNWPAIISMNAPLRYKGYTLYQASTLMDNDGKPVSVLSVVYNQAWLFPYISGVLLMVGLAWHLVVCMKKRP